MLLLPPIVFICGLLQLLRIPLDQTATIHTALAAARVGAVATLATRVSDVFLYYTEGYNHFYGTERLPPRQYWQKYVPPSNLLLHAAPLGAYVWESNPVIRAYTHRELDRLYDAGSRVHNALSPPIRAYAHQELDRLQIAGSHAHSALSELLRPHPQYLDRLRTSQSSSPGLSRRFSSIVTSSCSLFGPLRKRFARCNVPATPPRPIIPPNASTLSDLGRCGLGTKSLEPVTVGRPDWRSWLNSRDQLMAGAYLLLFALGCFGPLCLKFVVKSLLGLCLSIGGLVRGAWGWVPALYEDELAVRDAVLLGYASLKPFKRHQGIARVLPGDTLQISFTCGASHPQVMNQLLYSYCYPFMSKTWKAMRSRGWFSASPNRR